MNWLPSAVGPPALDTPGYVWERWILPGGELIEIVAERPKPQTSSHRSRLGVIWQCTACPATAAERVRLPVARERALRDLLAHGQHPTAPHVEHEPAAVRVLPAGRAPVPYPRQGGQR